MDVAVSRLRAELADYIKHVGQGEEVVITDRGVPVARLVPVDAAPLLERLTSDGTIGRPRRHDRPVARDVPRVAADAPVSEMVDEQRR